MVHEYFEILRRLVAGLRDITDKAQLRRQIALCIFQSVTAVETFLNVYFRVAVSEKEFKHHEQYFLKTITNRNSLEYKLKNWPKTIFNRKLSMDSGIGKSFLDLKNLRNSLMHFVSSHDTIQLGSMTIHGLTNIDLYENLKVDDAYTALEVAESFLCEVFRLRGIDETQIHFMLRLWSGKGPALKLTEITSRDDNRTPD